MEETKVKIQKLEYPKNKEAYIELVLKKSYYCVIGITIGFSLKN